MNIVRKNNATFFLFVNAFLWGSSYVWSKMLLGYLPRFSILFLCSLGGMISTTLIYGRFMKSIDRNTIFPSIIISLFSVASNTFCMFALQYTGSSNTAFIVQTSVIITPIIMALIHKKKPESRIMVSAVTALLGVFLLTCNVTTFHLNVGDLLALGNAVFFSIHLASLKVYSKNLKPAQFTVIFHIVNTVAFLILAVFFEIRNIELQNLLTPVFAVLIIVSTLVTVLTILIQSSAIKFVIPEKAVLIYTFEPVTAFILAYLFIGEKLEGIKTTAGFLFILFSVLYSVWKPKAERRSIEIKGAEEMLLE